MKILVNQEIRRLFIRQCIICGAAFLLAEIVLLAETGAFSVGVLAVFAVLFMAWTGVFFSYFQKQDQKLQQAVAQMQAWIAGEMDGRIACDEEGELYRLFHAMNSLASVLGAHVEKEQREKEFLRDTISDISHQLKTPLAALNIYNGLVQEETKQLPDIRQFADLSEQELDRMETLVQNLLKITRLDAGTLVMEKQQEPVAEMLHEVAAHFAYRAGQEEKQLILSGPEEVSLLCDRGWMQEALDNLVKNALDHTTEGNEIRLEWKARPSVLEITVADNGCGIHPEDLHYIFKRFYRSRFSKDTKGLGLGLPLAKAIIEAHDGTIEVDSEWGRGTVFTIHFLIPTKL